MASCTLVCIDLAFDCIASSNIPISNAEGGREGCEGVDVLLPSMALYKFLLEPS
jgi:hypothetical protein